MPIIIRALGTIGKSFENWVKKIEIECSTELLPWLSRRTNLGVYDSLLQELRLEDEAEYRKCFRMTLENFDKLLELPSTLL